MKFSSFIDVKNKEIIQKLKVLSKVVGQEFDVKEFLEDVENPYLYVSPKKSMDLPFDGVRVYQIGSSFAYRVQNENKSEPYGSAYPLNIEQAYEDLTPDMQGVELAKTISDIVIEEFDKFFDHSAKAEVDQRAVLFSRNPVSKNKDVSNQVTVGRALGDYSNSIY